MKQILIVAFALITYTNFAQNPQKKHAYVIVPIQYAFTKEPNQFQLNVLTRVLLKEEGFEVLGVSLDRDRNKWLKAIEADGLVWQHVSDLKGWQNEVANMYGVRSIPHTILLDREGKIIAQKLRGGALEAKLEELFK